MKKKFKIGDVVMLNSGGPKMTVEKQSTSLIQPFEETEFVECIWFKDNNMQSGTFHQDTLDFYI